MTPCLRKHRPMLKNTLLQQQQQKQQVKPIPKGQSLPVAPILPFFCG